MAAAVADDRFSPYLATGALCARQCVRAVMKKHSGDTFDASRGSGPGVWIQEIGWRDFYTVSPVSLLGIAIPLIHFYSTSWRPTRE